jgi:hypothetical protein
MMAAWPEAAETAKAMAEFELHGATKYGACDDEFPHSPKKFPSTRRWKSWAKESYWWERWSDKAPCNMDTPAAERVIADKIKAEEPAAVKASAERGNVRDAVWAASPCDPEADALNNTYRRKRYGPDYKDKLESAREAALNGTR